PAQTTRDEIVTTVLQHVEKRVIGLKNPSVEFPHENPDNVGIHQPSHASPEQGGCVHLFVLFCGSKRLRSDGYAFGIRHRESCGGWLKGRQKPVVSPPHKDGEF